MKEQKNKKVFQNHRYIVSYALDVSVNAVMCVCSPFEVIRHITVCKLPSMCPPKHL